MLVPSILGSVAGFASVAQLLAIPAPTQFNVVQQSMYPFFILAVLIDASIAAIWYMAGVLLNNYRLKAGARGEFIQVIGTALIAGIILASLLGFGAIYYDSVVPVVGTQTVLSPQYMYQTCALLGYDPDSPSGSIASSSASFSFVTASITTRFLSESSQSGVPPPIKVTQNPSMCDIIYIVLYEGTTADTTTLVDYPLASAGVVNANLTNQIGSDLSDIFVLDSWLGFQQKLTATVGLCFGDPPALGCAAAPFFGSPPVPFIPSFTTYTKWTFPGLAGLELITKSLDTLSALLYYSIGAFVAQLLFINIFLYIWPWLIFIGLVLRGIYFTRRIGGLFIAVAIGAILIYPMLFGVEMLAANNPTLFPPLLQQPIDYCGTPSYNVNFYNLPNITDIASACGCWPANLAQDEAELGSALAGYTVSIGQGTTVVPTFWGPSVGSYLLSLTTGTFGFSNLPQQPWTFQAALSAAGAPYCPIGGYTEATGQGTGGEGMIFSIAQAYGVIGVSAYFVPLLNVIMTLVAIVGLSGLMGGDVQLAGLTRFI